MASLFPRLCRSLSTYRNAIFYHSVDPKPPMSSTVALSFLPSKPPLSNSETIIGYLPSKSSMPADFTENPKFRRLLHCAIRNALANDMDDIVRNTAIQTQQGWIHIHDNRNLPPLGRIGDADDLIATIRVENGKIIPDTYQPMPSYRLFTHDGILELNPGLQKALLNLLEEKQREEQQRAVS